MADKTINELVEATQILQQDLFVLQQENTAKKLSGQTLVTYLLRMIDGHGGIVDSKKISAEGLVDTYRFTFVDETFLDIPVTNGRAITSIKETSVEGLTRTYIIAFNDGTSENFTVTDGRSILDVKKTGTEGLVDTYTIFYNDGSEGTLKVANGAKGDKGDNTYTHFKFSSQEPTDDSHSMGDLPDNWMGIYWGSSEAEPTDWKQYIWVKVKGEKGETGDPAVLLSSAVQYLVSDSGVIIPSGAWSSSVPVVAQGKYLWTRVTTTFNTGDPVVSYSVSRMGLDGSGSVSSVADISPDETGNVPLTASDVGALPDTGGDMTGSINMNGQKIYGLNVPTEDDEAATKGYVEETTKDFATETFVNDAVKTAAPRNLLDNSDFTNPVNQRGKTSYSEKGYNLDRWLSNNTRATVTIKDDCINLKATTDGSGFMRQTLPNDMDGIYTLAICVRGTGQGQIYTSRDTKANAKLDFTATADWSVVTFVFNTADAVYVPNQFSIAVLSGDNYDIKWAALYEGEYTPETLPEYHPKGYAVELAECQRYYYRITASWKWITMGICISETQAMFTLKLPQPMRIYPTITIPDPSLILVRCGSNSTQTPTAFGWDNSSDLYDIFQMEATVSGAGRGVVAGLYFDGNGVVEFSADFPGGL